MLVKNNFSSLTMSCGVNMKTCAGPVQYPVRPKVREIEIKRNRREEPSQMCPYVSIIEIFYLFKLKRTILE